MAAFRVSGVSASIITIPATATPARNRNTATLPKLSAIAPAIVVLERGAMDRTGGLELLAPLALPDGKLALSLAECQKHTN
jgi:hypothetical protein